MALFFFLMLGALSTASALAETNSLLALEKQVLQREKLTPGLLKGTEAHFLFRALAHPTPTERAIVYLHGFSASPPEVTPLVENLGRVWNANAFFARYSGHGFEGRDGLSRVTLEHWKAETRAAIELGKKIGKKVVVVATSTGATLALLEVLRDSSGVEALVLLSPNFGLQVAGEKLLLLPYGLGWLLGRVVIGAYRRFTPLNPRQALYWTPRYPFTAVIEMVKAVEELRNAPLGELRVPVLVAYSEKDRVVDLPAIKTSFGRLGSPVKALVEIKNAENDHVIAGDILSPSGTSEAQKAAEDFLRAL